MLTLLLATGIIGGASSPEVQPVLTLTLAKQHLEYEDTDRDGLIAQYIAAAAAWVENYTGKLLTRRSVTLAYTGFNRCLDIGVGPDPVVTGITYFDSAGVAQTWEGGEYRVIGGRVYPVTAFPYAPYGMSVVVTAGYAGTVPADLISAQLLLIGHYFANREAVASGNMGEVPLAVEALCRPYRPVLV